MSNPTLDHPMPSHAHAPSTYRKSGPALDQPSEAGEKAEALARGAGEGDDHSHWRLYEEADKLNVDLGSMDGPSDRGPCPCARIADSLEQAVGNRRYEMWFSQSTHLSYDPEQRRLHVATPNRFIAERIGRDFHHQITQAAHSVVGQAVDLSLTVEPDRFQGGTRGVGSESDHAAPVNEQHGSRGPRHRSPSASKSNGPNGGPSPRRGNRGAGSLRHRLDQFIVGDANRLAFAAAQRMASEDAAGHPAFIHGGCGLGKTHLLQGACHALLVEQPEANVRYTTGEQFTNEYIQAVRNNKLDEFRRKMRRLDLLAVDDVHFMANKDKTQQEFLHSIDAIDLSGSRLLLASDSHPKLIREFSEGLVSRCVRGLVVEIQPPDEQTRRELIRGFAKRKAMMIRDEAVEALATDPTTEGSVREIEGALTKLHALATLGNMPHGSSSTSTPTGEPPTVGLTLVRQLIGSESSRRPRKPIRLRTILETVCDHFGVAPRQVTGSNRQRQTVIARAVVVHLARQLTAMSYPEIASGFGKKNHSTIISAGKRMRKLLDDNQPVQLPGRPTPDTPAQLLEQLHQQLRREQQ